MGARGRRNAAIWDLAVAVALAVVLAACEQPVTATPSPGLVAATPSGPPPATGPVSSPAGPSAGPPKGEVPAELLGRTWLSEGPDGWLAGTVGGATFRLDPNEVGMVAADQWILSADRSEAESAVVFARSPDGNVVSKALVGPLIPSAVAVLGDRAFVSGHSSTGTGDPGVFVITLESGAVDSFVHPEDRPGFRYLRLAGD